MPTLPDATVSISEEASALAGGTGYCLVLACVEKNADLTPRVFASQKGLLGQHGYSAGVDFAAKHMAKTRKAVLFVGLPTATPGAVGRQNSSGVTGSCAITVASGAAGFLEETNASVTVLNGGTIGIDGIILGLSLDDGRTVKRVRLGTANSYAIPYVGIVLNFAAGTLNAGDKYTFATTPPMWDGDGLAAARAALARQQKPVRSWMVIGDIANSTFAGYVTTQINDYETENKRFSYARVNVRDRLPTAAKSKVKKQMLGAPNLTFLEVGGTGDTITRSSGSWIADGFAVGDVVTVALSASNNVTGPIASLSPTVLTFGTTDLANEGPVAGCTVVGSEGLTFAEIGGTGDTITRTGGSWLDDGFRAGDVVTVAGTGSNNVSGPIAALTPTVLTFGTTDLAAEIIGSHNVTITAGETMSGWVSTMAAALASVDGQKRIDIAIGRARVVSEITGWSIRRPAAWHISIREYQHDVHHTTWAKEDGPLLDVDMTDGDGTIVEFDEASDGGGLANRFSCLRTWENGPEGAFVAMSLTRDTEGEPLSFTHNLAVANVFCTVVQTATENAVGKTIVLDADGHGTAAALGVIESNVDTDLEIALLQVKVLGEGPRASKATWKASTDDVLRGTDGTLTGAGYLDLNGTLVHIETSVNVR